MMAIEQRNDESASFQEAVLTAFRFLEADYDYRFHVMDECEINATSRECLIAWYLEWECIVLSLGPRKRLHDGRHGRPVGIGVLIACLDPAASLDFFAFRESGIAPSALLPEAEHLACLLRQYCEPMLRGDFSSWPTDDQFARAVARLESLK